MKNLFLLGFLGFLLVPALAQNLIQAQVSPEPGTYPAPLTIEVSAPSESMVRYRFLDSPGTTYPWTGSLSLDALPGESRAYGIRVTTDLVSGETVTKDYRYRVFRPSEPLASVQPEPGYYWSAVSIRPTLPPGWKVLENGLVPVFPRTIDAPPGRAARFVFEARGPLNQSFTWTYVVDRRDQETTGLDLVSPVEGTWANAQALVATFRGVDRVLWSYGDRLDPKTASEYSGPVVLDRPGKQTLTVAARSRIDGRWIERTVTWTNGTDSLPISGWPESGVFPTGLSVPSAPDYLLSWDDGRSWQTSRVAISEASSVNSRKILSLQLKKDVATSDELRFRYVYWLDARPPQTPTVEFIGGWNPRLVFSGGVEVAHWVFWTGADGKSVREPGLLWGPVGSWKVPDGTVAARVQAVGTNGLEGQPTTVGFAETGWSTPTWEPWDQRGPLTDQNVLPLGGRVLPRPGFWPVYEISADPQVSEPGPGSPLLTGVLLPLVPWGCDRTFYTRLAWRDAAGLVGPSTNVLAIRVDRVPPPTPEVLAVGGQILLKLPEGEEEGGTLFWAVTAERVSSADTLVFQPYRGTLDVATVRNGAKGRLWFHAQAQDRAGNSGQARLNVALAPSSDAESAVVHVDQDPAVGEIPVENGGVYPWTAFRLRALDQSRDLWVGVSDPSELPSDWQKRLQPWTGVFSRGIARGERRTFQVFWNAKTSTGWAWATPKTLTLTLDLSMPVPPLVSGTWPSVPQGESWTLGMKPGRTGDTLRYTFTLDGREPLDPMVAGELWPGTRTWEAPAGGKTLVRIRVAAVSVSGRSVEPPLGGPVLIDRSPPASVSPPLDPFTYSTQGIVVTLPPVSGVVRYTLTTDGRLPEVPTEASPTVPNSGLVLPGTADQSLLYRFRWRTYSLAGLPGLVTDPYGVLIDRTVGSPSVVRSQSSGKKFPLPELRGVPRGGVSAVPVTLTSDLPANFLRFEVREGVGDPRPVTAQSSVWQSDLVLDPGLGVDRSYAVSVKAFSAEGVPISDEVSYLIRVDRCPPAGPEVALEADPRRPEAWLKTNRDSMNPEESLYYRWTWDSFNEGTGEDGWKILDRSPVVFSAPHGAITRLRLEAYLQDEVGNVGPTVERNLLIDQNVVYLSSEGRGTGTREGPLGTLSEAVDKARKEGKSILLVAAGNYPLSRTLDLGGLRVFGGLSVGSWEQTADPGRSLWTATAPFEGDTLVESADRPWSFSGIDLSTGFVTLSQIVSVKGAHVTVRNGSWNWGGAQKGWDQEGGGLDWANVTISYIAEPGGTLLDWRSLESSARGLRLSATQNQGGLLVSLKNCVSLFQDLVLISKQAKGFDGVWAASQSRFTVDQARIQAGDGADRTTAFYLKNTDASFWNTDVGLYGALSNTGYQVSTGKLEVQKGSLGLLAGREFNQGLVLDGTETVVRSFEMKIESGAYQGGISIDGGSLKVASSKVRLAGGGLRVWGAQFLSPTLVNFEDVSWVLGTKTPGDLWKREKPWSPGSSVTGSLQQGW